MYEDNQDFQDERKIEVSDLPDQDNADQQKPAVRHLSLDPRFTPRQRKRQAILTGVLVLIVVIALLVSNASVRDLVAAKLNRSSSPTGLASGPDLFYFESLPTWGNFYLDGHPLTSAPTVDSGPPARLTRGAHRIAWQAEPFYQLRCTLVVPSSSGQGTCQTRPTGPNEYTTGATLITFPSSPSLNLLPPSQQQALAQVAQGLLDSLQSSTIVQPGEPYAYNQNTHRIDIATRPLRATLRFLLDTNTTTPAACMGPRFGAGCSFGQSDCRKFCTLSWPQNKAIPTTLGWHVAAVVRPTWQYTPLSDTSPTSLTRAHSNPSPAAPPRARSSNSVPADTGSDQYLVAFRVEWQQGKWQVTFHPQGTSSFDDPNCTAAIGMIMAGSSYLYIQSAQQRVTWTFSSGVNRASGCLASATLHRGSTLEVPISHTASAYVIYRFGVLLAANEAAHELWPNLPLADESVQNIAQAIARQPAFVS